MDDGRTDDGRTTEHGYTISSPCEPDGSGELKRLLGKFAGVLPYGSPSIAELLAMICWMKSQSPRYSQELGGGGGGGCYMVTKHYCLYIIFQKLPFSKSVFFETPQETCTCNHVTILHCKSLKQCYKNFENRLTNKNFMPENNFQHRFFPL